MPGAPDSRLRKPPGLPGLLLREGVVRSRLLHKVRLRDEQLLLLHRDETMQVLDLLPQCNH